MIYIFKKIRDFFGYLTICVSGNGIIRFLNICKHNEFVLWDMSIKEDKITMSVSIEDFFRMRKLAKKTGVHVRIMSKKGKIFKIRKYKKRYFFLIGLLIFYLLIKIISLYIWNISFDGNYSYTDKYLTEFLNENGIQCGNKISKLDCDEIEFLLRKNFDDIVWVSAEIKGTKLIVHIKENFDSNIAITEDKPYNIISNCDGIIESIITRNGTPMVKKNDEITTGQTLVSGVLELTNDSLEVYDYRFVNADADIFAKVREEFTYEFSMNYEKKVYTGNENKSLKINILNKSIYLSGFKKKFKQSDILKDFNEISLTKNFYLPLSYEKIRFKEYEVEELIYTAEEANGKAQGIINNYIDNLTEKGIQIIENNVKIEIINNKCVISGNFLLLKQIGKIEYINEDEYLSKIPQEETTE